MTLSSAYDEQLACISHYKLYPEFFPWIGQEFASQSPRILVLGESHYLRPESVYHHDAAAWYAGVNIQGQTDRSWMTTRQIIANGIVSRWKEKSKLIYRNIEVALRDAGINSSNEISPFQQVAFMNYFQRPAQVSGGSIRVSALDREHSATVLTSVLEILKPQIVVFCSVLARKAAREAGVLDLPTHQHIRFIATTHPATRWWHTQMRKYKGQSGKDIFIHALQTIPTGSDVA